MIVIENLKCPLDYSNHYLVQKASKILGCKVEDIVGIHRLRESLDARKITQIYKVVTYEVVLINKNVIQKKKLPSEVKFITKSEYQFPQHGEQALANRPCVIGAGPAGLFCAYYLAKSGFAPILIERGEAVEKRIQSVDAFFEKGILNPESNVAFGEGGAGTFSDGKLNTLVKDKTGRVKEVLRCFHQMGAKEEILYQQKPHIGTDILVKIVQEMRQEIINLGGEVRFETKMQSFKIRSGKICGILLENGDQMDTDIVVLATGHSARDTYEQLALQQIELQAKAFAVGFRVMHDQNFINHSRLGEFAQVYNQPADYKLTAKTSLNRGVYSFCMCPGGYVVNASSEANRLAINGMSYSDRGSKTANSAIILTIEPKDYDETLSNPLAGIAFQRSLEEAAYKLANGKIPIQKYIDFKNNQLGNLDSKVTIVTKGEYAPANLRSLLKEELNDAFIEGMQQFNQIIKGFASDDTLLAGIESRTSSPVRIVRDDTLQSNIKGLYPCGEGAGYAGGITSASADGLRVAEIIASMYHPDYTL